MENSDERKPGKEEQSKERRKIFLSGRRGSFGLRADHLTQILNMAGRRDVEGKLCQAAALVKSEEGTACLARSLSSAIAQSSSEEGTRPAKHSR